MKPSVQGSPLQRPIHVKRTDHVLIRPDKSHANNMRVRRPLAPRRPYSRVLISQLQTTSENSFGSKVHPAARSSILGHRVSGNAIRSGGVPALVHAGKICRRRQGCVFHSARPRQLWKTLSQHLSFGATIRATQGCDPSADSSPEWTAAFGPPPGLSASPSKKRQNFVQTMGSTSSPSR
jgi:hypothetical protein